MVSFTVKVKCDHHSCNNTIECECILREGDREIPEVSIADPKDWSVDIRKSAGGYYGEKHECLCPEHNPYSDQNMEKARLELEKERNEKKPKKGKSK